MLADSELPEADTGQQVDSVVDAAFESVLSEILPPTPANATQNRFTDWIAIGAACEQEQRQLSREQRSSLVRDIDELQKCVRCHEEHGVPAEGLVRKIGVLNAILQDFTVRRRRGRRDR